MNSDTKQPLRFPENNPIILRINPIGYMKIYKSIEIIGKSKPESLSSFPITTVVEFAFDDEEDDAAAPPPPPLQ